MRIIHILLPTEEIASAISPSSKKNTEKRPGDPKICVLKV